ncbi:hypothetical protein COT97_01375 [Candidatus Falkowbacteria bacterium CG10_big_fil_rev_8_21_14_0_10_39_11]|uniref:Hydrolase TatD n=1 Tax=Candidatus Falkowbacteria bacterium CG10_big_fil_rev_8_21_14_0_10_39_11 TaxID=1974565 RepID=A0A2H0V5S6_9BACT|nr:MAG: hypothetical protein COT97_01375 [Candidatus Falkowbacteria bacterium CG10_big_fil_rev_8_21_14_0_10_39_11]
MIFDTHAHVNFVDFKDDHEEVLKRAREKDVVVINVGSQISTSERAVVFAEKFPKTFAAVGLHPVHLQSFEVKEEGMSFQSRAEEFDVDAYELLAAKKQTVAIGECGLDYFHIDLNGDLEAIKEKQKQVLNQQIDLASKYELPLIFHCRGSKMNPKDAYKDLIRELKKNLPKKRGVIHCFGSDWPVAEEFLELGFYLGFTGVITFDKTGKLAEVVRNIPEAQMLSETDCPYLTPEPYRGKRNEPIYVEYVVQKIAELRNMPYEQAAEITGRNAKNLFGIVV